MSLSEEALISAVIQTADLIPARSVGVEESWFREYGGVWSWVVRQARASGKVPDKTVFKARWPDFPLKKTTDVKAAAEEVRRQALQRMMIGSMKAATADISSGADVEDVLAALRATIGQASQLAIGAISEHDAITDIDLVLDEIKRRQARKLAMGGTMTGVPFGWPTLDKATNGAQPGELIIVAARLGVGKSWSMIRWAFEALKGGIPVQFDSLEQPAYQVMMRLHALMGRDMGKPIRLASLSSAQVSVVDYEKVLLEAQARYPTKWWVDDTPRRKVTTDTILAQIQRNNPGIVFVDYLTLLKKPSNKDNWQAIADISADLAGIAQETGVPIVAAAQLNRSAGLADHPDADAIAQADAIGQDAHQVITLKKMSRHCLQAKLVKYRHGESGAQWYVETRPNVGLYDEVKQTRAKQIIDEDAMLEAQQQVS